MGCSLCDNGWVTVPPEYAERLVPEIDLPDGQGPEWDAIRAEKLAEYERAKRAAGEHVYPCKRCQPETFARWASRHYEPGHHLVDCGECAAIRRSRAPKRRLASPDPPPMPERKDLL